MNSKEKLIIQQLLKIANNQQKMLIKLAQTVEDPMLAYLRRAGTEAAGNSGLPIASIWVSPSGNGSYTVTVNGAAKGNIVRQKYIDTLKRQISTQKPDQPELSNNLAIIFAD